jgi:hypothetical protein
MWQDTSKGDGGADQSVELFITADGKLEVARGNALDFKILGGVLQIPLARMTRIEDGAGLLLRAQEPQR